MAAIAWAWGFIWLVIASFCLWPVAKRWLADSHAALRWPLAVGLSLGGLTLWMAVVGLWGLNVWAALAFPIVASGIGILLPQTRSAQRTQRYLVLSANSALSAVKNWLSGLRRGETASWVILAGLMAFLVVLGQSTYYPFIGDDEISRYAYYARLAFVRGRVTDEVRGYPMFMPMAYAYVFFVTGQIAEQLARLIPALLSAAAATTTGALGARWYGTRGGWAAAFALIATPLYLRWSPDGYVDVASALYFALCAYAGDVWLEGRERKWAVIAGLMAGLALWTKQPGFFALACLGLVFAWGIVRDWMSGRRGDAARAIADGLLALLMAFLFGGWWYVRNAYYDGWANAVPGPGNFYYEQAQRGLAYAVPFIGFFRDFGEIGSMLYLAGLGWGVFRLKRTIWPMMWAAPYTLLWWRLFSYDPRFLLTVIPFYAAMFGGLAAEVRWTPARLWRWALAAGIVAAASTSIVNAKLGGLRQWIVAPGATYEERLVRAKHDMYPTVEFIRDNISPTARIVSMDGRLQYYLIDRQMDVSYPARLADLYHYDYFVAGSWWYAVYDLSSEIGRELDQHEHIELIYAGPTHSMFVYRILKP
jgi:hypothetical protein